MKELVTTHATRVMKFAVVGGLSTIVDWGIYLALVHFSGFWHQYYVGAKMISISAGSLNAFYFNKIWTFKNRSRSYMRQLSRQAVVALVGLLLNAGMVFVLVDFAHFNRASIVTIAIATAGVFFFNYPANHFWVFREEL